MAAGVGQNLTEQSYEFRVAGCRKPLYFVLVGAGHTAGFEPRVTLESNESERIRRLVSRGLGIAILPRSDALRPGSDVAVAALVEPKLRRDITLAWRDGRRLAPAAAEFLALSRELFSAAPAEPQAEPARPSRARAGSAPRR